MIHIAKEPLTREKKESGRRRKEALVKNTEGTDSETVNTHTINQKRHGSEVDVASLPTGELANPFAAGIE